MPETIGKSQIDRHISPQNRLNYKLNERLEYSGIYSNRDPQRFFSNLSALEQRQLFKRLKLIYYQILFNYFSSEDNNINNLIDRFVEEAFFANFPMNKVIEIHIELIDILERELIFKGLNTKHLSNFRLTLIDVITHLGEMYRSVIYKNT